MTSTPLAPRREGIRPPKFADQFSVLDFEADPMPVISLFKPPRLQHLADATLELRSGNLNLAKITWNELESLPRYDLTLPFVCQIFNWHEVVTWHGVRLADLIAAAGAAIHEAGYLAFRSSDGHYFETLSHDEAMDPRVIVAFGMNGDLLPEQHGAPLRLVVPFLQGYKSVKWLSAIQAFRHDPSGIKRLLGQSKTAKLGQAWADRLGIEPAAGRAGDPEE